MATTSAHLLLSSPAAVAEEKHYWLVQGQSNDFVKAGNDFAKNSNWTNAQSQYQQALELRPKNEQALYGLATCSLATGDIAKAIDYNRQAIYHDGSASDGFYENNVEKLMQFALLLNRTGQAAEAVSVYNHAASLLDYQDSQYNGGKPHLKVLLPEIAAMPSLPSQVQYTPERLQALADTALSRGGNDYKQARIHIEEAVALYPDSAAVQYYLGEVLSNSYYVFLDSPLSEKKATWAAYQEDKKATAAAYKKAVELGDDATVAAAKERIAVLR